MTPQDTNVLEDHAASIFTSSQRWRQQGPPQCWYPTANTTWCHNSEDFDLERLKVHDTNNVFKISGVVNEHSVW